MVNAGVAAVRHQPVPGRDVAEQQVRNGDETVTEPKPIRRCFHCRRLPSQPHDETCPTRQADPTPTQQEEPPSAAQPPSETDDTPTIEEPPYSPWDRW